MHSMGIHSALAIKRQRKRRNEAKRAKERRHSTVSTDSNFDHSDGSLASKARKRGPSLMAANSDGQTVTSIGMLHVGVVFLVLGTFLLISGMLPDDISKWQQVFAHGWFNELVLSGSFALLIGVFLISLNKILAKKEDDDLSEYVARQLTRTKSGQRLVRDVETGGMSTKHEMRQKVPQDEVFEETTAMTHAHIYQPGVHSPRQVEVLTHSVGSEKHATHLELIEEECSEKGEEESRCVSKEDEDSGSPSSPSETQELLAQAERYFNMVQK